LKFDPSERGIGKKGSNAHPPQWDLRAFRTSEEGDKGGKYDRCIAKKKEERRYAVSGEL